MTSPTQGSGAVNPSVLAKPNAADARVAIDQAMAGLDDLGDLPVAEHVQRFEAVHSALSDALGRAESAASGAEENGS